MRIPKKITPDRIKSAIIEIRYASVLPYEIVIGYFFKVLDDSYTYSNRPSNLAVPPPQVELPLVFEVAQHNLFYNKLIKIQLKPNSIVFTCLDSYIGWAKYLHEITKFLEQISRSGAVDAFNRVGIRYVSEYPNIDLRSAIHFDFRFGMADVISQTYSFRSEFEYKGSRTILNIHNKLPVDKKKMTNPALAEVEYLSQIDVDVIQGPFNITGYDIGNIIQAVEKGHELEKEIFFSLLQPEFLENLNPEY